MYAHMCGIGLYNIQYKKLLGACLLHSLFYWHYRFFQTNISNSVLKWGEFVLLMTVVMVHTHCKGGKLDTAKNMDVS